MKGLLPQTSKRPIAEFRTPVAIATCPSAGTRQESAAVPVWHAQTRTRQGFGRWHAVCYPTLASGRDRSAADTNHASGLFMAQREETSEAVIEAAPAGKKSRKKLVIVVALVVVLGSIGAGGWMMMHGNDAAATTASGKRAKGAKTANAQPELYLAMQPAFVANFRDDDAMRYLQVGVSLMSHDQAALTTAQQADPVIRDALLMLFSRQTYAVLSDPVGKQKLQAQALETVRKIVGERLGRPGIDALYFTSFVMQ
jgi:flagellar FliL protein